MNAPTPGPASATFRYTTRVKAVDVEVGDVFHTREHGYVSVTRVDPVHSRVTDHVDTVNLHIDSDSGPAGLMSFRPDETIDVLRSAAVRTWWAVQFNDTGDDQEWEDTWHGNVFDTPEAAYGFAERWELPSSTRVVERTEKIVRVWPR